MKTGTWLWRSRSDADYRRLPFLYTFISQWRSNFQNEWGTFLTISAIRKWLTFVPLRKTSLILNKFSANIVFHGCLCWLAVAVGLAYRLQQKEIVCGCTVTHHVDITSHTHTPSSSSCLRNMTAKSAKICPLKSNIPELMELSWDERRVPVPSLCTLSFAFVVLQFSQSKLLEALTISAANSGFVMREVSQRRAAQRLSEVAFPLRFVVGP